MTWDEERIQKILASIDDGLDLHKAFEELTELVVEVRTEAIGWTWADACHTHAMGLDPCRIEVPSVHSRALADLNPERDDG